MLINREVLPCSLEGEGGGRRGGLDNVFLSFGCPIEGAAGSSGSRLPKLESTHSRCRGNVQWMIVTVTVVSS